MIKKYKEYISYYIDKKKLISFLRDNYIYNYTINKDLSIDVQQSIRFRKKYNKLPYKFNHVFGDFDAHNIGLNTLENCPNRIDGIMDCSHNSIETLEFLPKVIYNDVILHNNKITKLDYNPVSILYAESIYANQNKLDLRRNLISSIDISDSNILVDLNDNPLYDIIKYNTEFSISITPINKLLRLFITHNVSNEIYYKDFGKSGNTSEVNNNLLFRLHEFEVLDGNEFDSLHFEQLLDFSESYLLPIQITNTNIDEVRRKRFTNILKDHLDRLHMKPPTLEEFLDKVREIGYKII